MLLLDAGNSQLKWALVARSAAPGRWTSRGALPIADRAAWGAMLGTLPRPERVLVSNVAGEAVAERIREVCAGWGVGVEFVPVRAEQCGVRGAYPRLGSDRWMALIAAWRQVRGACLVVDCGTATTVDALSGEGAFLGGLILPGVRMMQESLAAGTAQLEAGFAEGEDCNGKDFPRDTADAIICGAVRATVGAILEQYRRLAVPSAPCLLDGGAAGLIAPHLEMKLLREGDLVLKGLQVVAGEIGKDGSA